MQQIKYTFYNIIITNNMTYLFVPLYIMYRDENWCKKCKCRRNSIHENRYRCIITLHERSTNIISLVFY